VARHQWLGLRFSAKDSMSSIGSVSFWQQDQNYWSKTQSDASQQATSASVIDNMFGASTTLATGLASIANQTALNRVNTALTAAVQSALNPSSTSSSSSSSTSSSSNSSVASAATPPLVTPPSPATGTGTTTLTGGASLYGLDYTISGTFTVSDGNNTTTYTMAQGDTVGDVINAINSNAAGNANAFAYLNANGNLVITATNATQSITVGGDYAAALGFGGSNSFFAPTAGSSGANGASSGSSSSTTPSSSSSNTSSTGSSGSSSSSNSSGISGNSAFALQTGGTAEILLAGNGSAGSLVNLLA
jgi:hypothetical protein